jgi:iron(III) transport system ATP-binding protein
MTVRGNDAYGLEERKTPAREIGDRVDRALDLVGLRRYADRRPSQLSGGQQQRVALARTIVVEPRVLLLDEPLSNLDANLRVEMRREILALQRKLSLTTIFVTHDQEEANTISDRIAVLDDGVIQQVGSPMQLYDEPCNRFVANFLGTANLLDGGLREIGGKTVFVASEGLSVPVEGATGRAMGECTLMVRPQSLRIAAGCEPDGKGVISLPGDIEHSEFLGSVVRYSVRAGGCRLLVDQTHLSGQPAFGVGDAVVVSFESRQTRVLGQ